MPSSERRIELVLAVMGGLAVMAAACGRKDAGLYAERSTVAAAPAVSADAPPAWQGRWARSPEECAKRPFVFDARRIEAPTGSWCAVGDWRTSPAGYSLTTLCRLRGGEPTPGRLLVTVPDRARGRTMTVEGGPLDQPLGLIRCPAMGASAPTGAAG